MSKRLFFLLLAGTTFATVNAQVRFGVKGGLNIASWTGSGSGNSSNLVDFHLGGLAKIYVGEGWSVQPELVYSGQGAKVSSLDATFHEGYLNVPVLLKYTTSSGFFGETGPQLGFLLGAKYKTGGNSASISSSFKSTDLAWAFGIGYMIPRSDVGINMRYNVGLTNIATSSQSNGTIKNSVFQLGLLYFFTEPKKRK
ncbi:porin family protein [Flavitalea flava]